MRPGPGNYRDQNPTRMIQICITHAFSHPGPKSTGGNPICEFEPVTPYVPGLGLNGTWVTLYYQDMGYSCRCRSAVSRSSGNV